MEDEGCQRLIWRISKFANKLCYAVVVMTLLAIASNWNDFLADRMGSDWFLFFLLCLLGGVILIFILLFILPSGNEVILRYKLGAIWRFVLIAFLIVFDFLLILLANFTLPA